MSGWNDDLDREYVDAVERDDEREERQKEWERERREVARGKARAIATTLHRQRGNNADHLGGGSWPPGAYQVEEDDGSLLVVVHDSQAHTQDPSAEILDTVEGMRVYRIPPR
jgi:hypothetical protein